MIPSMSETGESEWGATAWWSPITLETTRGRQYLTAFATHKSFQLDSCQLWTPAVHPLRQVTMKSPLQRPRRASRCRYILWKIKSWNLMEDLRVSIVLSHLSKSLHVWGYVCVLFISGYGEDGRPIRDAFVVGIAGTSDNMYISHHKQLILSLQVALLVARCVHIYLYALRLSEHRCCTDARCTADSSVVGVYSDHYHLVSGISVKSACDLCCGLMIWWSRIVFTRSIPKKS
jgi:hypothetical protein